MNRGFSLVQLMIAIVIGSVLTAAVASVLMGVANSEADAFSISQLNIFAQMTMQDVMADQAWANTLSKNAAGPMACLSNSKPCTQDGTVNGAPLGTGAQPPIPFAVYDGAGNLFYDSTSATIGLDNHGSLCNTFDAVNGNDQCPFQYQIGWSAICSVGDCVNPQTSVSINLIYKPVKQKLVINPANYSLTNILRPILNLRNTGVQSTFPSDLNVEQGSPTSNYAGYSFSTDSSGGLYVGGYSNPLPGAIVVGNIDPTTVPTMSKFDYRGNLLWTLQLGGAAGPATGEIEGQSYTVTKSNNVIVDGFMSGNLMPQSSSGGTATAYGGATGNHDAFLASVSPRGTLLWTSELGAPGFDSEPWAPPYIDPVTQNILIAGYSGGVFLPAPGQVLPELQTTSTGARNAFLAEFNSAGVMLWVTQLGNSADVFGPPSKNWDWGIRASAVVINNRSKAEIDVLAFGSPLLNDFGPGVVFTQPGGAGSHGYDDIMLMRFDLSGKLLSVTQWGVPNAFVENTGVYQDQNGFLYVTSNMTGPGSICGAACVSGPNNGGDMVLMKFDPPNFAVNGGLIWAQAFGRAGVGSGVGNVSQNLLTGNFLFTGSTPSTIQGMSQTWLYNKNGPLPAACASIPCVGTWTQQGTHGLSDTYVIQFDFNGNFISSTQFGLAGTSVSGVASLTDASGLIISGSTSANLGGTIFGGLGTSDIFLHKANFGGPFGITF